MAVLRLVAAIALLAGSMSACGLIRPQVECELGEGQDCTAVYEAVRAAVPLNGADRVVIGWGRGRGFHAEAHVCRPDGSYVLVDVMGDARQASVRESGRGDPACT